MLNPLHKLSEAFRHFRNVIHTTDLQIKIIHDGHRFRKVENLERVLIEGLKLVGTVYEEPYKPLSRGTQGNRYTSYYVTVPKDFIDLIEGDGFEQAMHVVEPDGRDTLIFRGISKVKENMA